MDTPSPRLSGGCAGEGCPKVVSVLLTVLAAFAVIGGIGFVVASQLIELAMNSPRYQSTLAANIQSISSADLGEGLLAQVQGNVQRLSGKLLGQTDVEGPSEALSVVIAEPSAGYPPAG